MLRQWWCVALLFLGGVCWLASSGRAGELTSAEEVKGLVGQLGDSAANKRRAAEVALYLIRQDAFPELERESKRKDLAPDVRQKLTEIVDRQRPWIAARLRRWETKQQSWKWNERTALDAYNRVGRRSPKWDDAAREGIRLFVAPGLIAPSGSCRPLLEKAIDAGCDDPLVVYMEARTLEMTPDPDRATLDRLYRLSVDRMEESGYPADRKCFVLMRYLYFKVKFLRQTDMHPPEAVRREASQTMQHLIDSAVALWPAVLNEEGIPDETVMQVGNLIMGTMKYEAANRKNMFDTLYPPLERAMPHSAIPLVFKGQFYIDYAWDARGTDWASKVTPEGWKLMGERLSAAEQALTKAWELDPTNVDAPTLMLTVVLGQDKDRPEMELWFDRAMAAHPDNRAACDSKLHYLLPKWHGSTEEALAFGRECVNGNNWVADLPFVLILAHSTLAQDSGNPDQYYRLPQVWEDVQSAYVPYMDAKPDNNWLHSEYTSWAVRCGHLTEARQQFEKLGNKAVAQAFGGPRAMEECRQKAFNRAPGDAP